MMHGMCPYVAHPVVYYRDGDWEGSLQYPTFWVFGGCESDAIAHVKDIIQKSPGEQISHGIVTRVTVSVWPAEVS